MLQGNRKLVSHTVKRAYLERFELRHVIFHRRQIERNLCVLDDHAAAYTFPAGDQWTRRCIVSATNLGAEFPWLRIHNMHGWRGGDHRKPANEEEEEEQGGREKKVGQRTCGLLGWPIGSHSPRWHPPLPARYLCN